MVRPKRDSALLLQADFTSDAEKIPDFVRRLESGADLVIGQAKLLGAPRWYQWLRGFAHRLFRKPAKVEAVSDLAGGVTSGDVSLADAEELKNQVCDGAGLVVETYDEVKVELGLE